MATIGTLSVVFTSDIGQLEEGVSSASKMLEELQKSVDGFSKKMSDASSKSFDIKPAADTSEVKRAVKEVEELEDEIDKKSPTVKVRVSGSLGGEFLASASSQIKEYGESLVELGKSTGTVLKSSASAVSAVGDVLDGTSASVSGVITAVGRAERTIQNWGVVVAGATAATGVFLRYSGGLKTAIAAAGGSVSATARLMAAFGAATTSAVVGVGAFAAVMAVARVASAGLTEEARENVARWSAMAGAAAASAAGVYAARGAFVAIAESFKTSTSWAEFFAGAMEKAGGSVSSFAVSASRYLSGLLNVLTLSRVASGEFRESLARIGSEAEGIRNMADRFGSTVEQMLVLDYAARSAGVGMSQLARAQQSFYTNVSKVRIGQLGTQEAQEAKFAFDRLGISIDELRNKTPQQVFALVAGRLVSVRDAADRAAIAFDLFGRQAVNVLPALKGLREAENDSRRLGTTLSGMNFSLFEDVDTAFDRAGEAMSNLTETTLVAFAPLQAAVMNVFADIAGGAASAFSPLRTVFAAATVPFQQFLEVGARIINIFLRLVGVLLQFGAAFTDAAAAGPLFKAVGDGVKLLLVPLERMLDVAEDVARVFYMELNGSLKEGATAIERIVFIAQTFGSLAVLGGIFAAIGTRFRIDFWQIIMRGYAALRALNWGAIFTTLRTVMMNLLVNSIQASQRIVASFLMMYYGFVQGFVQPFISQIAVVITGNAAMATSALVTGVAMYAAFVIATAGLALIGVALLAVYQNFGRLYEYFANFGDNVGKLLTFEGMAEAASAIADAMTNAFMTAYNNISGFFGRLIRSIILQVQGIKTPEKVDAATSSVAEVVASRRAQQKATVTAQMSVANAVGSTGQDIEVPVDDSQALYSSLADAREEMVNLSLDAARFGEAGRKAFLAARADFDSLQQQLADNTIQVQVIVDENGVKRSETALEAFERRASEIRARLNENLNLADVISPEQLQQSAEGMKKAVQDAFAQTRAAMRGQDLGSNLTTDRFFPTSDEVKKQAEKFALSYQDELVAIEQGLQSGEFGKGQSAMRAAEQARENAKAKFDRNMGKIEADTSFASDIRKALEDAFLTPVEKYRKKLKEIQDNKSLTAQEKSLATVAEQKQMVESTFGKTAGSSLREREQAFAEASAQDQYGRNAFTSAEGSRGLGAARESAERTKLDIERRKAVGLDGSATQQLKAGADNIADIFGVTGMSMQEIQQKLSPEQYEEFQEAMKKNSDAAKASLGVQKPAIEVLSEAQDRLSDAVGEGTISHEEAASAARKLRDDFMSAIGVTKTPFEEFSGAIENIADQFGMAGKPLDQVRESLKGNADQLALFDRAVKQARDNLLSSLGVEKTPQQVFEEQMKKIDEAANATDPNKRITSDEATQARINAQRKRDEALGAGNEANNFASGIVEQRKKIEEAYGKDGKDNPEKFRMAMEKLGQSIPGAEEQSPVQKFKDQLNQLEMLKGTIGEEDFNQRKMTLQAQLQEDMKPALDRLAPDRRAVESSDVRSKGGVDTFFRILRGNDNPSLKAQLEIARNTRLLAEAADEPEAAPVLLNMQGR
jgi:hypothetical protein